MIPGLGRSPGEGNGNPLQYSCLENSMEGQAWWAAVHGVAKSWTRLSNFTSLSLRVCKKYHNKALFFKKVISFPQYTENFSSVAQLCPTLATLWTVAYQASPSMGFSRQENWSGLPFPSPEDLPDPGIEPGSPALEAEALTSEPLVCCNKIATVSSLRTSITSHNYHFFHFGGNK